MSEEGWTPAQGWARAGVRLGGSGALAFALSLGACVGLRYLLTALGAQAGVKITVVDDGIILVSGLAVGIPSGWLMARGLVNRTGLAGGGLLVAVLVVLGVVAWAAAAAANALAGEWREIHFYLCGMAAVAAGVAAARLLLLE